MEFLHQRRIEEAKRLFRGSKDYIYQIADQVGFKHPSYFSEVFKDVTGESPKAYRRRPIEGRGRLC